MNYQPRLRGQYKSEIVPALMQEFQYKSIMQVPRLLKISLNQGIGAALADKKLIDYGVEEMTAITGQKAVPTISKHTRPNAEHPQGGIIKQEAPIHISNLMVVGKDGQPSRIGRKIDESTGKLVRYSKKTGEILK